MSATKIQPPSGWTDEIPQEALDKFKSQSDTIQNALNNSESDFDLTNPKFHYAKVDDNTYPSLLWILLEAGSGPDFFIYDYCYGDLYWTSECDTLEKIVERLGNVDDSYGKIIRDEISFALGLEQLASENKVYLP